MTITEKDRKAAEAQMRNELQGRPKAVRARYDRRVAGDALDAPGRG